MISNPTTERLWPLFHTLLLDHDLASKNPQTGRRTVADEKVFCAFWWVVKTGCQWECLPKCFPSKSTCFRRLKLWREAGLFELLLGLLLPAAGTVGIIDASFVRARSGGDEIGLTRAGKGCCLQAICDLSSLPTSCLLYSAGPAEARVAEAWLAQENVTLPDLLLGDAAYDTQRFRNLVVSHGSLLLTSADYGRRQKSLDAPLLRSLARGLRWRVERFFAWLSGYRRVTTRYEKSLRNYAQTVALAIASVIAQQTREEF